MQSPTEEEWLESIPPAQQIEYLKDKIRQAKEDSARMCASARRSDYDRVDQLDDDIRHFEKQLKDLEKVHGA